MFSLAAHNSLGLLRDNSSVSIANVILIDDDSFIRSSLSAGLSAYGINVVGVVENISKAFDLLDKNVVDVVVVDLDLGPGPSGVEISHYLRKRFPKIGLVMLTSFTELRIAKPNSISLPKGCRFISKSSLKDLGELVNVILIAKTRPMAAAPKNKSETSLTDTQLEVLKLVAEGFSSFEIAERRGVSQKAVEGIISKIHNSLDLPKSKSVNMRVQLARAYFTLSGRKPPSA